MDGLLNITEVARLLGLSVPTIRRWTACGTIPHFKVNGGAIRFDPAELRRWVEQYHVQGWQPGRRAR